jgi:hypothetical protein
MAERCRDCPEDAVGLVIDPYDVISDSPISREPVFYCLFCYNRRVLGALEYVMQKLKGHHHSKMGGGEAFV